MATITGGLRLRLIRESLFAMIEDALDQLDWFDGTRPHLPVTFLSKNLNHDVQIDPNTGALTDENMASDEVELGSLMAEHRWIFYVDFFAESDALGLHFIGDVKGILEGRMNSIGRDDPSFTVYDYRQATPPSIATCQIEDVTTDRAHGFLKPWLEHWYAAQFTVLDYYADET